MAYKDPQDPRALESRRQHYLNNKQAYIDRAKANTAAIVAYMREQKDRPCMDCGLPYPPYVMQFDHRPGEAKAGNVASMARLGSLRKVKDEIAKCDVVCANCHAERTYARMVETTRGGEASISLGS